MTRLKCRHAWIGGTHEVYECPTCKRFFIAKVLETERLQQGACMRKLQVVKIVKQSNTNHKP